MPPEVDTTKEDHAGDYNINKQMSLEAGGFSSQSYRVGVHKAEFQRTNLVHSLSWLSFPLPRSLSNSSIRFTLSLPLPSTSVLYLSSSF